MVENEKYIPPNWAGKPPHGLHLDVMKGDKLIQKLMIDEKSFYTFGRNSKQCDFIIDHDSCSRTHAVLIWHQHLQKAFLIDLGSVHGTFIGSIRLESKKPQQISMDSPIHFGASTRYYFLKEKPHSSINNDINESLNYQNLPEDETELENLTEFNTAHNRRITSNTFSNEDDKSVKKNINKYDSQSTLSALNPILDLNLKLNKPGKHVVRFSEREETINPEDIDPSIGKYRNLIQTMVLPKTSSDAHNPLALQKSKTIHPKALIYDTQMFDSNETSKEDDYLINPLPFAPRKSTHQKTSKFSTLGTLSSGLGLSKPLIPNPAPDVSENEDLEIDFIKSTNSMNLPEVKGNKRKSEELNIMDPQFIYNATPEDEKFQMHKKKIYAKEAWPGKRANNYTSLPPTLLI